jgi:signal transduction histidine kinase
VTLAFAVGMAVVLAALGAFLYLRVGADLMHGVDMELRSRAQVILGAVRSRDPALVRSSAGELIDPDEAFAQVLDRNGRILDTSPAVASSPMLDARMLLPNAGPTFISTHVRGVQDPARLLAVPAGRGPTPGYVVVGATLGDRNDALARLLLELAIGGPVALLFVSFAGWLLAGAALRPVERMRREADAISLAEPARRLAVPGTRDELDRLGATLNSMLDRLHGSLQREQQFLDEASHELRTPLGVLRMELDLALSRARTTEELQEALRQASTETDRLVRLAEDLLVLSRTREGSLPVHRRETSVRPLLEQVARAGRGRAGDEGVVVDTDCEEDVIARIDPDRIRQALDNLVDNAIRHAGSGGRVMVSASRADGSMRLLVRDTGPGFPQDVLQQGPKAFARGNGPRGTQRSGLGLAIVGAIAEAHGGTLLLWNPSGGGASAALDVRI